VPKPTLSRSETACLEQCTDKFLAMRRLVVREREAQISKDKDSMLVQMQDDE
jgi:hypothetical protein